MKQKLRVWHIPQIATTDATFYIPVETLEEGKKIMDLLACYDLFQFENRIKPYYTNANGLQVYNEDSTEWENWYSEECKDVEEYLETNDKVQSFRKELFIQLKKN